MSSSSEALRPPNSVADPGFATTHWSIVLAAGKRRLPESEAALETLCRAYWYPLYAYVRRRGHSAEDARDLTQEFFATVLEKDYLLAADPQRGRFRTFLLTALQRFVAKQHERARALKRGGGHKLLSLDLAAGEERYRFEPSDTQTPERLYDRQWALTLLNHVLTRLAGSYAEEGKAGLFDALKGFLTGIGDNPPYRQIAADLGMTEGAVKVAVHRLRGRYRELLREEIGHTVASAEEVQDEMQFLLEAVCGKNR